NFLASVSKSRRPSLEAKIACSMLMVPTLVPVALAAAAAAAEGALGAAAAGAPAAGSAWARAKRERPNTTATVTRANFLIIGSFELLRIFRKCWKLPAHWAQRN